MDRKYNSRVFLINSNQMVVADSIEDAIKTYRERYEFPYDEINSVEALKSYGSSYSSNTDNSAFISTRMLRNCVSDLWSVINVYPEFKEDGTTDLIVLSVDGHIESGSYGYTEEQWKVLVKKYENKECHWAYEEDLIL